jgi:mono/diheme cytochrome c family protein
MPPPIHAFMVGVLAGLTFSAPFMSLLRKLVTGLLALVGLLVAGVFGFSSFRMSTAVAFTDSAPAIPSDSATLARGRYLATAIAKCTECHGADLGGKLAIDAGPVGTIYGPNLTSGTGGVVANQTDADLVHAIRHGLGPGGRKLRFMPALDWYGMADEDAAAIVAYVRSVPPVDRTMPASVVKPLGRALYAAGQLPLFEAELIDHAAARPARPATGVTAEYGGYLARIGGCTGCHGPGLSGGPVPGTPPDFKPASNLTPEGIGHYTEADFFRALREGKRPDGSAIDPFMPWALTKLMTDDDTRALWKYLVSVPRKPFGNR